MTYISFSIPGNPVAKGRPRFARNGHTYTPDKTRIYEETVRLYATQAMRGKKMLAGAIGLRVTAYFPIPKSFTKTKKEQAISGSLLHTKKPDADNIQKIISDACNRIVYQDDAQISEAVIRKRYSDFPRVDVTVTEILGVMI